jgi:hypothetical protein
MKWSVPLMLFAALVLGGCTRTIIERPVAKETVIEKPVVVERPAPAIVAAVPMKGCNQNSTTFSHGSYACQLNYQYRCNDGAWESTNIRC